MRYLWVILALSSCASLPSMTEEECREAGGYTIVDFRDYGRQCCKLVQVDGSFKCQVLEREQEFREPHIRERNL